MRVNVEKVLERDQKLSDLDDRAGEKTNAGCVPLRVSVRLQEGMQSL